jgi:hypothetical protein
VVDTAGNLGPPGPATLPIVVPDARRPAAPRLRRVVDADRAVWLQWDGAPAVIGYRVLRAELSAGAQPDVRDMTLMVTLSETDCPEPLPVAGGTVRLPGDPPHSIVAVYRADEYDLALAPEAQTADPVLGPPVLSGTTVTGLGALTDGAFVFVVGRQSVGATPQLLTAGTGRAWRDQTVTPGRRYQYRVQAVRIATVGPGVTTDVRSLPSEVGEGAPFEPRPPVPPTATAAWQPAQQVVRIVWAVGGTPTGLEVALQKMDLVQEQWAAVGGWSPAATGAVEDPSVTPGHAYLYRLRARNMLGRTSQREPEIGPVIVP